MKKIFTIVCVFMFATSMLVSTAYGQAAASVTWTLFADQTFTTVGNVTGVNQSGSTGFVVRSYSQAVTGGVNATSQRWWPSTDGTTGDMWGGETGPVATRYIQFVAAPATGSSFRVDSFTVYFTGGGTGSIKAFMEYSTNASFSPSVRLKDSTLTPQQDTISGVQNVLAYIARSIKTTVSSGQSIYVRIFPWYTGSSSNSKYVLTQYAVIKGTTTGGTGVEQKGNGLPGNFELGQNYPNPFNPTTQISYNIPKESFVSLKVFNLMGQEVATLISGNQTAGRYTVPFDASRLSSGVYMYRLQAGSSVEVKRMMFVK